MEDGRPAAGAEAAAELTLELGRALHRYGAPAHRLEAAMTAIARRLGVEGHFFSLPTAVFASFAGPGAPGARFVRVDPGEVDLGKMADLDRIVEALDRGELAAVEAGEAVRRVVAAPPRYGRGLTTLCFGLASGAAARFFGGGAAEIATALAIGLLTGVLALLSARLPRAAWVFEPVAATAAAVLATAVAALLAPIAVTVAILGGLIVLVPGLTLTVAINELAMRNLVSGTARLASAAVVFVEIGFGVTLGGQVARLLPEFPRRPAPAALPAWTEAAALLVACLALAVLFRARPRDLGWIVGAGVIAFGGARGGAAVLGGQLGVAVGALLVGLTANLYARRAHRPAAVPLVPGIMLLVPGGVGFRSLASLLERDVISGIELAFTALMIAVALVAGLLLANALVSPRRAL